VIDYCQAHPNEGAFEFLSRNLRRFGLWLWASPDGDIIIGGPTYSQAPSYRIQRKRGLRSVGYTSATYTQDHSQTVSYVEVRGKNTSKEWEKGTVSSHVKVEPRFNAVTGKYDGQTTITTSTRGPVVLQRAANINVSDKHFLEPMYIQHDQAENADQAQAFALQELSRLQENAAVYEVTAVDHRCMQTGNIFAVDTTATVEDEFCFLRDTLWVAGRTFKKSVSAGTTTDLKLLPLYAIQIGDVDA
jgi:prophage tail gpP-like protein